VIFSKEQAHHAGTVVRLDGERIRLVHEGRAYFATGMQEGKSFSALVTEEDPNVNELHTEVTLCMALIRREKMEWVLQKATELGVSRIVPFESSRCVVHRKKEKTDRWMSIVTEAARQCKRNRIPEIVPADDFANLGKYLSDVNLAGYENAWGTCGKTGQYLPADSCTVVIGPEGGFSEEEVEQLRQFGYQPVTFGNRILRAETAAVYALSVIGEFDKESE